MKIILLQDVPNVGRHNEIKEVREGYARNFLLPQKLAALATDDAVKRIAREKAQKEEYTRTVEEKYRKMADRLKNSALRFTLKMGEKGTAFGSVSGQDIVAELKKQGIEIEKSWIARDEHIKTTGEHIVPIQFPGGIKGETKVMVEGG